MRMHWIRILMTHNADGVPNKSPTKFLVYHELARRPWKIHLKVPNLALFLLKELNKKMILTIL